MEAALNLEIIKILTTAAKRKATDIHLMVGSVPVLRVDNSLMEMSGEKPLVKSFLEELINMVLNDKQKEILQSQREVCAVYIMEDKIRFRVNVFYQKNALAATLKIIPMKIPGLSDLSLPRSVKELASLEKGLIVISGTYNSGRSTTAAALIEEINKTKSKNILTIERPIEYLFLNNRSIIEQREVGRDAVSFTEALNYCKQEDVDVILVGENSEPGVTQLILDLASSGRLVFLIMNTVTSIQSIDWIISSFRPSEKEQARDMLSQVLLAAVSQRLLPKVNGGLALAMEVLINIPAVSSLIRDGKTKQIISILQSSREEGMMSLDQSLANLTKNGEISDLTGLEEAIDKANFKIMIR